MHNHVYQAGCFIERKQREFNMSTIYNNKTWSPVDVGTFVKASDRCHDGAMQARAICRVTRQGLEMDEMDENVMAMARMVATEHSATLPSMDSLVSLLHDCAESKDLVYAKRLHHQICSNGLELLADHAIFMFAQCGGFQEAQQVFDKLFSFYEVCWSSLIKVYAQYRELQHAVNLLQEMQELCIPSNKGMLVALVQACTQSQCVTKGRHIHLEIAKEGYEEDVFIGSALVDMYGKCDQIWEAQDVFNELPYRDTVAWTSLIGGYAEHGLGVEAFNCLKEMELEGIYPDASTFVCVLKACDRIEVAQNIHAEAVKEGYETNPFIHSSLVNAYAKCGLLADAKDVLDGLPDHDVAWNALIAGYVECGLGEEALKGLEEMIMRGICPDPSTFVCCLKACGTVRFLGRGQRVHVEVLKRGWETNLLVGNSLVDMYGKCCAPTEAQKVFNKLVVRNDATWNSLIACFVEHDLGREALGCVEQMLSEEVHGGAVTFLYCLKACGSMEVVDKGLSMHSKIVTHGSDHFNSSIGNALVDMYAKCGALPEALEVFNKLPARDVVSWNSLIAGYAKHGHGLQAHSCISKMQMEAIFPDVVSYNSVILGFAEQGEHEKAKGPYVLMQEQGILPDYVTFINILKTCCNATGLETGKKLDAQVHDYGGLAGDAKLTLTNALMDMYSGCGSMVDTQRVFDAAGVRNDIAWNALITGYTRQGEIGFALDYFEKMLETGIKPCAVTFLSILTACSHAGLGDRVEKYFELMNNVYAITPSVYHHNCLVDCLVRAGQLDEAATLLEEFYLKPDQVVWNTMLGACQKWGNEKIEKTIHASALKLIGK